MKAAKQLRNNVKRVAMHFRIQCIQNSKDFTDAQTKKEAEILLNKVKFKWPNLDFVIRQQIGAPMTASQKVVV